MRQRHQTFSGIFVVLDDLTRNLKKSNLKKIIFCCMENFYSYTLLPYHVCIFDSLINLNTSNINRKPFHDGHSPSI